MSARVCKVVLMFFVTFSLLVSSIPVSGAGTDKPFLHPLFTDHMVLQRDVENVVWGWTSPGEKVSVEIGGKTSSATADINGKWAATIGPFAKGGPYQMKITGSQTVTVSDILFGEVWLCSGQSNMAMQLPFVANGTVEVQNANNPNIRFLTTPYQSNATPKETFGYVISWQVCNSQTVANLSGVGYFFAQQISKQLDVPVGIICSAVGGSFIESWIGNEAFKSFLANDAPVGYQASSPNVFYNGMIAPLIPYRVKGIMWYQGESNSQYPDVYGKQLSTMIKDWRSAYGLGDIPFMIVQLPNYQRAQVNPVDNTAWARVREGQLTTALGDPNNSLIITIDVGDAEDIHPKNKQDVGNRAALSALGKFYGKSIVYSGPIFKSAVKEGDKIRISFNHIGSGLAAGKKVGLEPVQFEAGLAVKGFAIAGSDNKFVWANAVIENNTVVVSAPGITNPVDVRYGWADNPIGNLYNKEGLPASPFRTDATYKLTVTDGTGSGTYKAGESVTITANTPPAGMKFDRWTGNIDNVEDIFKSSTTIKMPSVNTTVKAGYIDMNATPVPTATPLGHKVSGYVAPDLSFSQDVAGTVLSGFNVELSGTTLLAKTDSRGYFEINNVPSTTSAYTLKISKSNYLLREVKSLVVTGNKQVSSAVSPLLVWAGDIAQGGVQDNAINMADIMEIAKMFNSSSGDARYVEAYDLDRDNAINMTDIMIVAKHFNATPLSYPQIY